MVHACVLACVRHPIRQDVAYYEALSHPSLCPSLHRCPSHPSTVVRSPLSPNPSYNWCLCHLQLNGPGVLYTQVADYNVYVYIYMSPLNSYYTYSGDGGGLHGFNSCTHWRD